MVILLTGGSGFIGRHLAAGLEAAGHVVITAQRGAVPGDRQRIHADFSRDLDANAWVERLRGIDAVINTVGIIRETGSQTFDAIHTRAPVALFDACVMAGVRRIVQISALGADKGQTRYFATKRAADAHLTALPVGWMIVQPSLVYGADGTSAAMFNLMASLPLVPVPGRGEQLVQPIHIDDLVQAVIRAFDRNDTWKQRIPLVGPRALPLRDFLAALREAMNLGRARFVGMPMPLMRLTARLGELTGRGLLDRETLAMLVAGNTGDPSLTQRLLQRPPRAPREFIRDEEKSQVATMARLSWLLPLLRVSVALVWIWTGIASLGLYPREASYELLARTGVPAALAPLMLYGAALLDLAFGLSTLLARKRRLLWLSQMTLIAFYTLVITFKLPEFWLHPYGPILKNLPLLAAIYLLYSFEPRVELKPWNT
jgi:uncharacterized protein YbjT (DUF2867 family)/uncharacterized membrane protein YphA (DoxX/SURF4 family)